ncbi:hypothetical protein [Nocardioides yefusunii]|uniref:ARB-07466-like C-terminal domain-containing protein n=1 Tax=Nocardioides yefusunii TaxID=2500546 RepID=A0ABW1QX96_9ACTN|nr:hypothetical protein [Nocardioides yefusunii]
MAHHRHQRDANARKLPRAAAVMAPVAVLATVSAVTLGLLGHEVPTADAPAAGAPSSAVDVDLTHRESVSRSSDRTADAEQLALQGEARAAAAAELKAEQKAEAKKKRKAEKKAAARAAAKKEAAATAAAVAAAKEKRWATTDLNLWSSAAADADNLGILGEGTAVLVTGRTENGRTEVVRKGKARWVTSGHLVAEKPVAPKVAEKKAGNAAAGGTVGTSCSNGTSIPAGLDPSLSKVHAAVCARWPQITDYGTTRTDGEHGQGRAVDVMVSGPVGWEIADHLRAHASELGIEYLIYEQKIWSVERGGEGWRAMSDRGSATANHFDHVHVTVW